MIRLMTMTGVATALALALATAASAQTSPVQADDAVIATAPVATAPATPAATTAVTPSANDDTAKQIAAWIGNGDEGGAQPRSVAGVVSAMPQRDRAVHGEVGASIGSGGYRSAYGVATMPIGQNSDVTVAIADEHLGDGNRRRGGYGYGYGYGGGDRRSIAIAVNLNGALRGGGSDIDGCDAPPPKWSLGLPDDQALSNRCRRLMQGGGAYLPR